MVQSGDLQVEASVYIQRRKWFLFKTKYNGTNNLLRKDMKNYVTLHVVWIDSDGSFSKKYVLIRDLFTY